MATNMLVGGRSLSRLPLLEESRRTGGLPKKIALATDGSEGSRRALRVAVDLAGRTGAELHVAHAWRFVEPYAGYTGGVWSDYTHLYEREARRLIDAQIDAIEALGGTVDGTHLLKTPPIDALLGLCDEITPDLLVMGSRGLGPLRRVLVGSVSEGVVHHARCPVLVVRGEEKAWPPKRVVIGHDGSKDAERAAEFGAVIGRLFGAGGLLVRAYQNPPEPTGGWSNEDRDKLDAALMKAQEGLQGQAEKLRKVLGNRLEARIAEGDAAAAILEVAEEEDESRTMIAVGSRGLGAISRVRLGSVSTNVLRVAYGPVLICPRRAA